MVLQDLPLSPRGLQTAPPVAALLKHLLGPRHSVLIISKRKNNFLSAQVSNLPPVMNFAACITGTCITGASCLEGLHTALCAGWKSDCALCRRQQSRCCEGQCCSTGALDQILVVGAAPFHSERGSCMMLVSQP